jgi:hypothetical protein
MARKNNNEYELKFQPAIYPYISKKENLEKFLMAKVSFSCPIYFTNNT